MQAAPTHNGILIINNPTADLRYDMGNLRLFASLDGAGNITRFRLPEGPAVLDAWQITARLDGVPVTWLKAEAVGRSWTLHGEALDVSVTLRTVCDADTAALIQVWQVHNSGESARVFTVNLDVQFDLRLPAVRVGPSTSGARAYRFLRKNPVARRTIGVYRWGLMDTISETQKHAKTRSNAVRLDVEALSDGFRARGDITATLRAGDVPADWQAQANGVNASYRAVIGPGRDYTLPFIVAAADDADPNTYRAALADADQFTAWLTSAFECDDPLLRSLVVASLNVAMAMYKELPSGFKGLWAGPNYAFPPRVYFRDSYWTALPLLPYRPDWVRSHIQTLTSGVHADGECPSGVIDRSILAFEDQDESGATDWLADHHDSPAFYVLLLHEYLAWTGDTSILKEKHPDGRTIWTCAQNCLNRLIANPAKDRAPNDWADNVLRSEWVTCDLALLYGALDAAADIARHTGESDLAATYVQDARHIQHLLQIHCWDEERGYYIDYRRTGDYGGRAFVEGHLALDTLLALRYGAAPPDCADQTLTAACDRLQTRRNMFQPYEDWGVMCCWPSYSLRADLFAKSAQSYHYHNGASWPYLNAMYAELLLERGDPDWRYVLARWWKVQLKNGWLTPAEYFSPAHPVGGLLQGWSGMGLSAMLTGGLGLRPALDGTLSPRTPPWGDCVLRHLTIHGEPKTVTVKNDRLKIT